MTRHRPTPGLFAAPALALMLGAFAAPAIASEATAPPARDWRATLEEAARLAEEGARAALEEAAEALDGYAAEARERIGAFRAPYGAPRVNERGDIIIPRRDPEAPAAPAGNADDIEI